MAVRASAAAALARAEVVRVVCSPASGSSRSRPRDVSPGVVPMVVQPDCVSSMSDRPETRAEPSSRLSAVCATAAPDYYILPTGIIANRSLDR